MIPSRNSANQIILQSDWLRIFWAVKLKNSDFFSRLIKNFAMRLLKVKKDPSMDWISNKNKKTLS